MDSRHGSSSRAPSPQPRDWRRCLVPHSELVTLQAEGYLPPAFMVPVRAGLATYKGGKQAESVPNPSKGERVCFVPYLIRGLGFPIHPFLRGLLEFYGLQLHHLTPASILHIAGFVAVCELFLGIEPHFALWKDCFASYPVLTRGRYIKWAEPKYGASPGPDIYPELRRRRPKTSLPSDSIWKMPRCRIQFGSASRSSSMLL